MSEIVDFFKRLLRPDSWPARWHCGNWTAFHGWLYIISSLAIAVAYFTIPLALFMIIKKSTNKLPFQKIFWLFILFIFACGFTHVMDALMFWYPAYRLSASVLFITALASWAALVGLVRIAPNALALKSPATLERIITERTEELAKFNEYLSKTNAELEAAQKESKLLIKQKNDFLSIASHELKTPLTTLKGYTEVMKIQNEINGKAGDISIVSKMDRQVNKLSRLITDLLDFTKIDNGQMEFLPEKFDFNELALEVVEEMRVMSLTHQIILNLTDTKIINGDRDRIGQVITNFLSNAIKYSPKANKVIVSTIIEGSTLIFSVEDFGLGIPELKLANVFDRFFRITGGNRENIPGMGLGLFIAAETIKRHDGEISVKSIEGKGSTFSFTLHINS